MMWLTYCVSFQKYLEDLHNLHEDWLIKKSPYQPPAPVLVLDANKDLSAMYELFEQEKSKILFDHTGS